MSLKHYFKSLLICSFSSLLLTTTSCSSDDNPTDVETETPVIDEEATENPTTGDGTDTEVENPDTEETPDETENPDGTETPDETDTETEAPITCLSTLGANYIVFEAEATDSPLGEWRLINKGDEGYQDNSAVSPINETHLEFTGNNPASGPAKSPLDYEFTAPSTGSYKLLIRLFQRLEGLEDDKCNDVYVKLAGDFTSATDQYTTDELKNNMKFFGRGVDKWGSCYSGENDDHVKTAIVYNLKEGEKYTFTMSGRSQRANIDYILLHDTNISITGGPHKDIAELNDAEYLPTWDCSQN